ncbi:hypothetical protein [Litorivivens sp.]|uniref:hypothetical protein n=3 Tax=Litorivivens sp. TaxID=2020868 RepID=UPI0035632315
MDSQANSQQRSDDINYDTLKNDIHQLRDDFSKLTHNLFDKQRGQVSQLRDEWSQRAKSIGDKTIKDTQRQIKERPLTTLLAIFLAGLFLGKLLNQSPAE